MGNNEGTVALSYTDTAISSSDQAYYTLPDWFLEQNVRTAQDLAITPDQMVLCNCIHCKRSRLYTGAFDAEDQLSNEFHIVQATDKSGQALDEIHYKTLAELSDATCASFIPSDNGKLSKDSTILFLMKEQSTDTHMLEPVWMRRAVMQVAKASKVSLIYLDLETLEELGSEFHQQDKQRPGQEIWSTTGWKPDMSSFTTFLENFFAVPSQVNADRKSWKRRHHSLSTVLDAAAAVRDAKMQGGDGNDAVLVHIMMDCSLANEDLERRLLERFAEMVQGRRENGQAVAILLSTKCHFYRPGMEDFRRIGGTEDLTKTTISDKIHDLDVRNRVRTGIINTQRMRRFMRLRLPSNMFPTEFLTFSSNWATADRGQNYESFGWYLWSAGDIKKAITLLRGRAWRQRRSRSRSQMSFIDILAVLEYMYLFYDADADTESQTTEEASDIDDSRQPQMAWSSTVSRAGQEWKQQKSEHPEQSNEALDFLMSLVGLEEPKSQFMTIKNLVDTARRQAASFAQEGFGAVFMGGPGSGKSTVAELYAQFLSELKFGPDIRFEETTGARLAAEGLAELISIIKRFEATEDNWTHDETKSRCKTRGVLLIDGAHEMVPDGADKTFNYLMDEVKRLRGEVAFLFAGPRKQMQSFVGLSPSFQSYVPFTFQFDDFTDGELHKILVQQLRSKFQGKMRVEGGVNGVFTRILARRIGRGRGSGCFANARDVTNTLSRVLLRQADRLNQSKGLQENTDCMFLTQMDLIGPPPTSALERSTAWKNLQGMTGLASVKNSIRAFITRLQTNYDRELAEEPPLEASLNKVFLGSPGTGKTTVAKYYADILTELGLLSKGEVITKSCSDFTGQYYGQSEKLTKAILDSARGNVLIIDEAHGLGRDQNNTYLAAVVDTIVAKVQATSTEDRAVLLLGYKDEMEEMYRRVNPGLARRFPLSSAFEFRDFSDEELSNILDQKLHAQGFTASEQAKQVAMEVLSRSRNHLNFGNAGEVDILLDRAKAAQQIRLDECEGSSTSLLTELKEKDFDADYDRSDLAESNIQEAFANLIGAEALVAQFQAYQRIAKNSKDMGLDPKEQIPFNFIFRGPPGTGKTTTARKLGRIFFDMGFLATTEVEVCSASELIGEYIGQTGPKTQGMFQKAMGKVLFIDEAYRLAGGSYRGIDGGNFGKEAVDEIVNLVTSPRYKNRVVVVLAGYDRDINHLLATNPGFGSRFSQVVEFPNISPSHCQELLVKLLQDKKLGVSSLHLPVVATKVQECFQTLSDLPDWGNARDVENLAKSVFGRIISSSVSPPCLDVAAACVYDEMTKMIAERKKRAEDALMSSGNLVEAATQVSSAAVEPSRSSQNW